VRLGREYSQGQRLLFIGAFVLQAALLSWLVFSHKSPAFGRWIAGAGPNSHWLKVLFFSLLLWLLLLRLAQLPFTLYRRLLLAAPLGFFQPDPEFLVEGLFYRRRHRFSPVRGRIVLLFWAIKRLPGAWWLAAAVFVSLWMVIQNLIWPVVVSPIFNRFEPVEDRAVLAMTERLAQKAGLRIDRVLVMDASKRTNKANAYFTGLGRD
jgi:STE24 endopeptidase